MSITNVDLADALDKGLGALAYDSKEGLLGLRPDGSVVELRFGGNEPNQVLPPDDDRKAIYDAHVASHGLKPHITLASNNYFIGSNTTIDASGNMATKGTIAAADGISKIAKDYIELWGGSTTAETKHRITLNAAGTALVFTAYWQLSIDKDAHSNVVVTSGTGGSTVTYSDGAWIPATTELTITLSFDEGYEVDTFTVNGGAESSPKVHTVAANIEVIVTSKESN